MVFLAPMLARTLISKSGIKKPSLSNPLPSAASAVQKMASSVPGANAVQKIASGVPNPTNAVQKITSGIPGANVVQKMAGVSEANAPFKNVSLSNVLPKAANALPKAANAANAIPNEVSGTQAEDKGWEVTLIRIYTVMVNALFTLIVFTWNTIYWIFMSLMNFIIMLIGFIISFITYMFIPCVVFIIVYFTVGAFWDGGMKPMLEVIMMGINGIVDIWNSVVRGLRSFGIPIDTASGFEQGFPVFWEFIKGIFMMVRNGIESSLKGVIFR